MSRTLLVVILTWLLVPAQAPGQIPPGYHIVDVPDLPGHEYFPRINNRGQVVFSWWREVGEQRTLEICQYDARTGELTQLTDDFVLDYLPDINDAGTVVWGRGLGPFDPNWGIYAPEIMMRTSDGTVTRITFDDAVDIGPSSTIWMRLSGSAPDRGYAAVQ